MSKNLLLWEEFKIMRTNKILEKLLAIILIFTLTSANFINPHGLPEDDVTPNQNYMSVRDLFSFVRYLLETYPQVLETTKKSELVIPERNFSRKSTNPLFGLVDGVDGLKTGHTEEAGYCLTTSSKRGPMRLISVIFGAPNIQQRATQTRDLLAWGYANFETVKVQPANQVLAKAKVWYGQTNDVEIGLAENFNVTMPKGQANAIKTQLVVQPKLTAPLTQGQVVGKYVASLDGKVIAEKPLVALKPVEEAGFFARMLDHIKQFFSNLF